MVLASCRVGTSGYDPSQAIGIRLRWIDAFSKHPNRHRRIAVAESDCGRTRSRKGRGQPTSAWLSWHGSNRLSDSLAYHRGPYTSSMRLGDQRSASLVCFAGGDFGSGPAGVATLPFCLRRRCLVDLLSDMGAITALHRSPNQIQSEANQKEACAAADVGCYQLQVP